MIWTRRQFLKAAGIAAAGVAWSSNGTWGQASTPPLIVGDATSADPNLLFPDYVDPVLTARLNRITRVPNTAGVIDGQPTNIVGDAQIIPLAQTQSMLGHDIVDTRSPDDDLELSLSHLLSNARNAGEAPLADTSDAQDIVDILLGNTQGKAYDGFAQFNYTRQTPLPNQVPGEYKMKFLQDSGRTRTSPIDGQEHRVWEVRINHFWHDQNFDADVYQLIIPEEADGFDEMDVHWWVYSLVNEDLAPFPMMVDAARRLFNSLDMMFVPVRAGTLTRVTMKGPSLSNIIGLYNWGWGVHPPRIQVVRVIKEGTLDALTVATRTRQDLTIDHIAEIAPEKKMYQAAQAALGGAPGVEIARMLSDPDAAPQGTFRKWTQLKRNRRSLPPEAWQVLAEEDGLREGDFGDYDMILAFLNQEIYGQSSVGDPNEFSYPGNKIRDWVQGDLMRVKIINFDQNTHYYRNVDFGPKLTNSWDFAFPNGRFSFAKCNIKPVYGAPKVAEMQWRTGWGLVPNLGVVQHSALFPRAIDQEKLRSFLDQAGNRRFGYLFERASARFRFDPPTSITNGRPLVDADGQQGVVVGTDTAGFGIAKMPQGPITTHPDQVDFSEIEFPDFLRNPDPRGGDIIPTTQKWGPFLFLNPVTGTLKDPDGNDWVDQTYQEGQPVAGGSSIVARVEPARGPGQIFYQFDPLFHDKMIFSVHPRSDTPGVLPDSERG